MNTESSPIRIALVAALMVACLFAPGGAFANDPAVDPGAPAPAPPIRYQILQTRRVNLGDHALIMNRVAPPVFPAPTPAPPPRQPAVFTEAQRQAFLQRPRKKAVVVMLSATVYDQQVSEITWQDGDGCYRAFSNIDFTPITSGLSIETANARYTFMVLPTKTTRAAAVARLVGGQPRWIPTLQDFDNTQSGYIVMEDPAKPVSDEACVPIDALHVYYDANRQAILDAFTAREADRLAKEEYLREHPPVPKDTVINFWVETPKQQPAPAPAPQP